MKNVTTKPLPSAFDLFKPSFGVLMENIWTFLGLFAMSLTYAIVATYTDSGLDSAFKLWLYVISLVVGLVAAPAIPYTQLKSVREQQVGLLEALQAALPFVFRYFLLTLVTVSLTIIGMFLFIIPGVFIFQRTALARYYMIDEDLGVFESIKRSWHDTTLYSGAVWGVMGVSVLCALPIVTVYLAPVAVVLIVMYLCAPVIRYMQIKKALAASNKE